MCSLTTRFRLRSSDALRSASIAGFALSFAAAFSWLGWESPPARAAGETSSASVASAPAERPWQVVILYDGDPTLPAFVALDAAMRRALTAPGRHRVDVFYEILDQLRFPAANIDGELVALFAKKYASMHVDAVAAINPASLDFAELHRSRLWPDARIIFSGIPVDLLRSRTLSPKTTGIIFQPDVAGTVELGLQLRPETRRLIVIYGSGDFDRTMADLTRGQLAPIANRLAIEYWSDASVDEFVRRIAGLDRRDAVLYLSIGRDADGRTFVPREVLKRLSTASPAPVYGLFETYMGYGIVGALTYSYEARGKHIGEFVHEVLSSPPQSIRPVLLGTPPCVADANQLDRFGMDTGRLPSGCEVRFAKPSPWHEYKWYVLSALLVVVVQSALILALILQRRARRRAEDDARHRRSELAQASRLALAGELTASIAHEINQPLGAILANAGAAEALLRRGVTNSDEFRAIIADIKQADLRASDVIRRVRALVTTHEVEHEVVDVNTIVRDVLAFLHGETERRDVVVDVELASEMPELLADRVQLQQAVVNLCVNALDAMDDTPPRGRRLGVRTRTGAGGAIEIAISDTGPGIPPDQLPRLFDSFFTTKANGTGLGLSITRSIVDAHGGTLSAENRDKGALFRIVLPAYRAEELARSQVPSDKAVSEPGPLPAETITKGS
jgi:signal transduction histidine kinase